MSIRLLLVPLLLACLSLLLVPWGEDVCQWHHDFREDWPVTPEQVSAINALRAAKGNPPLQGLRSRDEAVPGWRILFLRHSVSSTDVSVPLAGGYSGFTETCWGGANFRNLAAVVLASLIFAVGWIQRVKSRAPAGESGNEGACASPSPHHRTCGSASGGSRGIVKGSPKVSERDEP